MRIEELLIFNTSIGLPGSVIIIIIILCCVIFKRDGFFFTHRKPSKNQFNEKICFPFVTLKGYNNWPTDTRHFIALREMK